MNAREALELLQRCFEEHKRHCGVEDALSTLQACVEALDVLARSVERLAGTGIWPNVELKEARAALKGEL